jgi:hypothetical protein
MKAREAAQIAMVKAAPVMVHLPDR